MINPLVYDLFIILVAGLLAGVAAKRFGFSMLVGYLLAGAVIGPGVLGLIAGGGEEIEQLAHVGALLLLFAIGIEFSLEELVRLSRYFIVGGSLQMVLVATPVAVVCLWFDVSWKSALLIAAATALSSTGPKWFDSNPPRIMCQASHVASICIHLHPFSWVCAI